MPPIIPINSRFELSVGGSPTRPKWSLPPPMVQNDPQPNHVLIVTGCQKGAGRNAYVNLLASTLWLLERPFAVVELDAGLGSASLAHRAGGAPVQLISPLRPDFLINLIDAVVAKFDYTVIVSVPSNMWIPFTSSEQALLDSVGGARPVGYAFVDVTGAAAWLQTHKSWLTANANSPYEHRLVLRGLPFYPPGQMPKPGSHPYTVMPFFEKQVADAVFAGNMIEGRPSKPVTFHAALQAATIGTNSVMRKPVLQAMSDIGYWLDSARALCSKELR